ncbi:Uncharacterized protein MCB1EB_1399 [Mycoavidus cysteinexigens]|uniref:Uncharacterized protein n=1 Tax=Mycoavidus cysteinexigens TaxID=1553431 RepID=A0A2Z6EVS0_9BURK|nr:DUF6013 family protein [Mycoavidus cysteinexigens]BBE09560.1 Uncharacterized protein MCB1EB_1399 [Mycoavidus cysteinexigens]GAM51676.1 hypothetical protein EBME_0139 [bacterium endosymbiont of Mortierella elongata FMR23-6]GLR01058.1 hypothetical protein GCM10007934_08700 [Mycoavidus cysteinexigens]
MKYPITKVAKASCVLAIFALMGMGQLARGQMPKSLDAPIHYTVKVVSKLYGNAQETRLIASGEVDDFTWKTVPPAGAVPIDRQCPDWENVPRDSEHAMLRQTKVRLAPIVGQDGVATIQLSFRAHAPQGTYLYKKKSGQKVRCPKDRVHHQIVRFTLPTNGVSKTIKLTDGTILTVTATR